MTEFFIRQLDYIEFVYGLAFILLSVISFILMRQKQRQALPWKWLGLFGLLHGSREWSAIIIPVLSDSTGLKGLSTILFVAAFFCLVEFCRGGSVAVCGRKPAGWVYAPFVAIILMGLSRGWMGVDIAARYSLCLAAGLSACWVLYRSALQVDNSRRGWLLAAAATFAVYVIAEGAVVPTAPFLPAFAMTGERFQEITGLPVQLLRASSAMATAILAWLYSQAPVGEEDPLGPTVARGSSLRPVILLLGLVAIGWGMTEVVGRQAARQELSDGELHLSGLAYFLRYQMEETVNIAVDRASSPILVDSMRAADREGIVKAYSLLDHCDLYSYEGIPSCLLRDRQGRVIAGCALRKGAGALSDSPFEKQRLAQTLVAGKPNSYFALDADTGERGYFVNVPVTGRQRDILGVVTVRKSLANVEDRLKRFDECYMVDPHGVIFLSSRGEQLLRGLWPLAGEAKKQIALTGQFGEGGFSPVLAREPRTGAYAELSGRRYLVTRYFINSDGWSIVLLNSPALITTYRLFAIFTTLVFCGLAVISFGAIYFAREGASQIAFSERRYRSLVEGSPTCIMLFDQNGKCLTVNRSGRELMGCSESDIVGKRPDFLEPLEAGRSMQDIVQHVLDGNRHSFNAQTVRHDGQLIFWSAVLSPIIDMDGVIRSFVGIFVDVTEKKRAELELQGYQKRLEDLVEERTLELSETNRRLQLQIEERLRAEAELTRHREHLEELVRERTADLTVANEFLRMEVVERLKAESALREHQEHLEEEVQKRTAELKGTAEELRQHREHLMELVEERTVELRTAVKLLTNEINFRKSAEDTLRESETRYRSLSQEFNTLLDAMPDILLLVSPELKILWANRAAAVAFGSESRIITGESCFRLWHDNSEPCEDCHVLKSFATGEAVSSRRTDAHNRILDSRAFPIRDDEGRVKNVILVVSDVTEKTSLQAEATRASHLASLGELAAGVAHEINNPINGIINYAQILLNRVPQGSRESDISGRIIKEGDRIAGIVRSLLSFARERKEGMGAVELWKTLGETLVLTETQIQKDGIQLTVDVSRDLPRIMASPQQLQQVFLNLISNSRFALNQKFPDGREEKRMKISAKVAPAEERDVVRITFEDNGTGIPAEIIDRVMHPFFSTKPAGQGTGLGLSISHGIIKNHGGKISIESTQGQFTRVMVDLPLREEHAG